MGHAGVQIGTGNMSAANGHGSKSNSWGYANVSLWFQFSKVTCWVPFVEPGHCGFSGYFESGVLNGSCRR